MTRPGAPVRRKVRLETRDIDHLADELASLAFTKTGRQNRDLRAASCEETVQFRDRFGEVVVTAERQIGFGSFRLDVTNERLHGADDRVVALRPKTFRVLKYLLEHTGQLVTKEQLLDAVWADVAVGDAVLKGCIREIRDALGDDPAVPRFIETRHRRGYRFIGAVTTSAAAEPARVTLNGRLTVGRERELALIQQCLERSLGGERQLVFVSGEPGIGKTTLVRGFAEGLAARPGIRVGHGQCLELFGAREPYLPVLEALGRLCRSPDGERVVAVLRQHAPTWLAQMPGLLGRADRDALQLRAAGATSQRMLREMAEATEVLALDRPMALVLEDLHWSDPSTLDLLVSLAKRHEPARLLVMATYRPGDAALGRHPIGSAKQVLLIERRCVELALTELNQDHVAAYLERRFREHRFPRELAQVLFERTDGHPLFLVSLLDDLVATGAISSSSGGWRLAVAPADVAMRVPDSVRQMIERQLERLGADEQRVLETASVAGYEFSSVVIASATDDDPVSAEDRYENLVRRHQFIVPRPPQELPFGMVTTRYAFVHALHRNVLYQRVPATRRAHLHRRIGSALEAVHGSAAGEYAAELAVHFDEGRDFERAVTYFQLAAATAALRFANHEVVALAQSGLDALARLGEGAERTRKELGFLMTLGPALIAAQGYGSPEVERTYTRARELCRLGGETSELFRVLWGLARFYLVRTPLATSREIGEEMLRLAERAQDREFLQQAHNSLGAALFHMGEFEPARVHLEEGIALYDRERHHAHVHEYVQDPGVVCLARVSLALWCLGYPEEALRRAQESLALAAALAHPFSQAFALSFTAMLHEFRGEWREAQEHAEAGLELSAQQGFSAFVIMCRLLRAAAMTEADPPCEDARLQIRVAQQTAHGLGMELLLPYGVGIHARACARAGRIEEACALLDEAFALSRRTGEHFYDAELYRLSGCAFQGSAGPGADDRAEASFKRALELADAQHARSWKLRTATSLARFCHARGERDRARALVSGAYAEFTEGFATADLRDARAVLGEHVAGSHDVQELRLHEAACSARNQMPCDGRPRPTSGI